MISAGIAIAAIISGVAIYTDAGLRATEGEERCNQTPQEIAQEVLTGQPAHSEANETSSPSNESRSETEETPAEREAEGR